MFTQPSRNLTSVDPHDRVQSRVVPSRAGLSLLRRPLFLLLDDDWLDGARAEQPIDGALAGPELSLYVANAEPVVAEPPNLIAELRTARTSFACHFRRIRTGSAQVRRSTASTYARAFASRPME